MATVFRPPVVARRLRQWDSAAYTPRYHNQLTGTLNGKDLFFGPAGMGPEYDWPNPREKRRGQDLRVFWNSLELLLQGKDQFFGAPGQVPDYELSRPQRRVYVAALYGWLNPAIREVAAIQAPFSEFDWTVPQVRSRRDRGFTQASRLLGQDKFFGEAGEPPSYDYPNPQRRVNSRALRGWLWSWVYPIVLPPRVNQWPQPTPRKFPRIGHFDALKIHFQVAPQSPFTASVLARPILRAYRNAGFVAAIDLNLLGQDQVYDGPGRPPTPFMWPVPSKTPQARAGFVRGVVIDFFARWQPEPIESGGWTSEPEAVGGWSAQGSLTGTWTPQAQRSSTWSKEPPIGTVWTPEEPEE